MLATSAGVKAQSWMINSPCTYAGEDESQPIVKYAYYYMLVENHCI